MDGIYFLFGIIGMFLVVQWYLQNEGQPDDQPTHGLFAMSDASDESNRVNGKRKKVRERWKPPSRR